MTPNMNHNSISNREEKVIIRICFTIKKINLYLPLFESCAHILEYK